MKVWYRGAALAGAALLWAGAHVGAQIRETVGLSPIRPKGPGLAERLERFPRVPGPSEC